MKQESLEKIAEKCRDKEDRLVDFQHAVAVGRKIVTYCILGEDKPESKFCPHQGERLKLKTVEEERKLVYLCSKPHNYIIDEPDKSPKALALVCLKAHLRDEAGFRKTTHKGQDYCGIEYEGEILRRCCMQGDKIQGPDGETFACTVKKNLDSFKRQLGEEIFIEAVNNVLLLYKF